MQLYVFLLRIDTVKIKMKAIIENISDETLERIIQVLDEVGVDSISDLDLFKEEDLASVLKIQARLLVRECRKNSS